MTIRHDSNMTDTEDWQFINVWQKMRDCLNWQTYIVDNSGLYEAQGSSIRQ